MTDENYRPNVKVKKSSAGLGLFALEDIPKEQIVIEYTGERITTKEADKRGGRYLFTIEDGLVIDGKGRENTARYINHSCKPNAEAEIDQEDNRVYIRACQKIKAGEEITYDYGKEYTQDIIAAKGCKCATCQQKKK